MSRRNKKIDFHIGNKIITLPPDPKLDKTSKEILSKNLTDIINFYEETKIELPNFKNYVKMFVIQELSSISKLCGNTDRNESLLFLDEIKNRWNHQRIFYDVSDEEIDFLVLEIQKKIEEFSKPFACKSYKKS